MRALFTGPLSPSGQTCEMRRRTLERLGHATAPVDYMAAFGEYPTILRKIQWRLRAGPMIERYNTLLREEISKRPELVWVEKGMFIHPENLARAKQGGSRIVHYSPDNYFLAQNSSRHFWQGLPYYDLVVTTKADHAARLKARGARAVMLSGNAFDPETHKPAPETTCSHDVSFVGRWEPLREEWLARVASLGVKLTIRGFQWDKAHSPAVRAAVEAGPALAGDYARAICKARINLGLLSRLAQDQITQRSVEIPACGGFMLAERTKEHLAHFTEGIEAAYFEGPEELCDKIRYYLCHDDERRRIAAAGRARCLASDYSYDARLKDILRELSTLR